MVLFLVFAASLWVATKRSNMLGERIQTVHEETLPQLLAYQAVESAFRLVVRAAADLGQARDEADLARKEQQLAELLRDLSTHSVALPDDPRLADAGRWSEEHVAARSAQMRSLLQHRTEFAARVEASLRMLAELANRLQDSILLERSAGMPDDDFARVREGVTAIAHLLQRAREAQSVGRVDELRSHFRVETQGIGPALTRLPSDESRSLGQPLLKLVRQEASGDGVFELRQQVLSLEAEMDRAGEDASRQLEDLRRVADDVRERAVEAARSARAESEEARRGMVSALWVLFAALCTTLLAASLYIERRVLLRLEVMVNELSELSRGALNVAITPGGDRELAELASAAEVFRRNALERAETLEELAVRNAELDQFTYAASHDLRSPLRAIASLSGWVLEDCDDGLPRASRDHLGQIADRTRQMEDVLNHMLSYSEIGRRGLPFESIELSALLRKVASQVAPEDALDLDLPPKEVQVWAQRSPLELALRHLVENSVVHRDRARVRLEARLAELSDSGFQLDLIDDGPGISAADAERAFRMFTRLGHERLGAGMGLTLVRRIAESVGGTLQLVPRSGRGTHIRLEWPAHAPASPSPPRAAAHG
ncbi:MAG: HAMP domain-containing sensor histidine kinase [Planctomycetota bacterium]